MIKAINHVGVSVENIERSVSFYRDLLGMEVVTQKDFAGEQYEAILGFKGAKGRLAMLQAGTMRIELFEFSHPSPKLNDPSRKVLDQGISHFCIEVNDIEAEYERLKAGGVSFHCPPLEFCGKTGNSRATYGRDPDGNVFELLEKVADAGRDTRAT